MDPTAKSLVPVDEAESQNTPATTATTKSDSVEQDATLPSSSKQSKQVASKRHKQKRKPKCRKTAKKEDTSSSSSSDSEDSDSDSSSSDDSEAERKQKKKDKKKRAMRKQKAKSRRHKVETESDDSSDSSSESDSSEDEKLRQKSRKGKKSKKVAKDSASSTSDSESSDEERSRRQTKKSRKSRKRGEDSFEAADEPVDDPQTTGNDLVSQLTALGWEINRPGRTGWRGVGGRAADLDPLGILGNHDIGGEEPRSKWKKKKKQREQQKSKRGRTVEYKRVDQLWDSSIHNYKLTESAEDKEDKFDKYVFTVRRTFDWENKYKDTVVDIKSKLLREALQEVMKDVRSVSLVEDTPEIHPNMLFLYLEEMRSYAKQLKTKAKAEKKNKKKKRLNQMRAHCKVLIGYLDEDYQHVKKRLHPMLAAGNITFDLVWALFKPNSIAFTPTYGSYDDPRCFKVDYTTKESSFMKGEWYSVEGRYLEYDGKSYGLGDFEVDIMEFKGPRKITSLTTYPLEYHRDPEGLKKQLVERGKHFVSLEGMNYRFHKGLAFVKKKKTVAKVNINGRIMIDPAIFRRINPNYPISLIKPSDTTSPFDDSDSDDSDSGCGCGGSDSSEDDEGFQPEFDDEGEDDQGEGEKVRYKVIFNKKDVPQVIKVSVDDEGNEIIPENIEALPDSDANANDPKQKKREFTEEELLIASPVVLGFAFSEKLWLEFSLSGVKDIEWNNAAFDSLVLPANQKSLVKALVESHKFHAAKTIDDVVQGKGKGLVAVLHGPPGTGKTLTAEGIAELLKCPLYMVSAGELGTDPARLEHELQKILDIAHSWGAVLLLDEADVFLEKREVHDIHRNALVSIFLRLLEYFQGILFLTTNRVETFDDAFQSRIHIALRYGALTTKAKRSVWKMFLGRVSAMEGIDTIAWTDADYDSLARNNLNGRQIKNVVKSAQALAVNEQTKLNMEHIKRVLEVAESFDRDLKGGVGYVDAMRSYT